MSWVVMLFRVALVVIPFLLGWEGSDQYDRHFKPIRAVIKRGQEPPRIARIFRIRRGERVPVTEESLCIGEGGDILESGEFVLEYEE